jgi:hypothetical protein
MPVLTRMQGWPVSAPVGHVLLLDVLNGSRRLRLIRSVISTPVGC